MLRERQGSDSETASARHSVIDCSGKSTSFQGEFSTGYLTGFLEAPETLPAVVSQLEARIDEPEQFFAQIRSYPGNYALALSANSKDCVYLIADRFGTRPIYYANTRSGWAWAFSLKELVPLLDARSVDLQGLDEIFTYRWLMGDHTLIAGVRQILPSHCVCLRAGKPPIIRRYTRVDFQALPGPANEAAMIERTNAALDSYFSALRKRHSRIAIFFSGGVDSSLLVAKALEHNFDKLIAVTAWFPGRDNPEGIRAQQIARHLGVEHRIIEVPDSFVEETFPDLAWQSERPPTYDNVFARARMFQDVAGEVDTVLVGEGADGMFSNERALSTLRFDQKQRVLRSVPWTARRGLAALLKSVSSTALARRLTYLLENSTLDFMRRESMFEPVVPRGIMLSTELVPALISLRKNRAPFYLEFEPANDSLVAFCQNRGLYTQNRNQYYSYIVLADVHGIQVEMPFLSPYIADIGLSLPDDLKLDERGAKPILKKLTCRYIPEEWVYASKLGFETPGVEWLKLPLAKWYAMLQDDCTMARGIFDPGALKRLDINRDGLLIWTAMTVEIFCRQFIDAE